MRSMMWMRYMKSMRTPRHMERGIWSAFKHEVYETFGVNEEHEVCAG